MSIMQAMYERLYQAVCTIWFLFLVYLVPRVYFVAHGLSLGTTATSPKPVLSAPALSAYGMQTPYQISVRYM